MITRIRYFFGFMDIQEKWLNNMSQKGYRLVHTGKLIYKFEECNSNQYIYCVDFVAHKSNKELEAYKDFLEDIGYQVMSKNINLNWSVGKLRLRPYGKGLGKIATSPGNYNKELFIVEKENDKRPFELHTTAEDKISYYKIQRNAYISIWMLLLFPILLNLYRNGAQMTDLLMLILPILISLPIIMLQKKLNNLQKQSCLKE